MKIDFKNWLKERKDDTINSAIEFMANNLDTQNDPLLGSFWYDTHNNELFGVYSVYADEVQFQDSSLFHNRIKTSKKLHKAIWDKEHFRRKDKRFNGDYTKVPRGRIFEVENEGFIICVGNWIKDYPNVIELIKEEFQLPNDVTVKIDEHWDIGHGWSQEF